MVIEPNVDLMQTPARIRESQTTLRSDRPWQGQINPCVFRRFDVQVITTKQGNREMAIRRGETGVAVACGDVGVRLRLANLEVFFLQRFTLGGNGPRRA